MILEYFSLEKGPFTRPWGRLEKFLAFYFIIITSYLKGRVDFLIFIPSPTKLRRDIVTLLSFRPSHPCEHSRINILQWIWTKLGTYLILKRIWNPIDFQGQRSRSPGQIFTA